MDEIDGRGNETTLVGVLATLLAGIVIGAAAVMIANQQNEGGGVKWPNLTPSDWRGRIADAVTSGREKIVRSVDSP